MPNTAFSPGPRLTPSIIISVLALIVACSGTAVAAGLITGRDIKNNSVTSKDIKNNNLTGKDVKNSSLTGKDVRNGSLAFADLSPDARERATRVEKPLWAIVAADGTLLRGNGVEGVTYLGTGFYIVKFPRSISTSPVSVSVISDGAGDAQINYRPCVDNPAGPTGCGADFDTSEFMFVNTENSSGANQDEPFMVSVGPEGISFDSPLRPAQKSDRNAEGNR
ncbi:hypothetical protein [Nocardioides sp.]|uniref:hypothetical protein n=1 Tax=Nocardioides sp. TaxID=35761 RepID=UPI003568A9A6